MKKLFNSLFVLILTISLIAGIPIQGNGAWSKPYTLDFGPSGDNIKQGIDKLEDNEDDIYTNLNLLKTTFVGTTAPASPDTGQTWLDTSLTPNVLKRYDGSAWIPVNYDQGYQIQNLKLAVNAAVNKLDIFAKTTGVAPTANDAIRVAIPDGTGLTWRTRAAAYLSGTSQFIMADATTYWNRVSSDGELKDAYVYAIWDGTGIVWALAGYSGFERVSTTTTVTDDDYMLLEASSTYTRSDTHYCVCVGRVRYEYDTADTPDHTFFATTGNSPRIMWNPKSDYGKVSALATTNSSSSDIAEYSAINLLIKQTGKYYISATVSWGAEDIAAGDRSLILNAYIKTGSATYGSATQQATHENVWKLHIPVSESATRDNTLAVGPIFLKYGDTIHLGILVSVTEAGVATRKIYGNSDSINATILNFFRVD